MIINGKVHCMFEQSGTFKNEFKKLGYEAYDYDIQNNFGETDCVIDLFNEIENGYDGKVSIFDNMTEDDLIIAFFPCIYFESLQMTYYSLECVNTKHLDKCGQIDVAIERLKNRTYFHILLYKLTWISHKKNIRLIIENPCTSPHYLINLQNFPKPKVVDKNRLLRGDYFKKPTAYWYFNCEPTYGESFQIDKKQKIIKDCKKGKEAGLCSEERSMISSDYARNFICDFIIGRQQEFGQQRLF